MARINLLPWREQLREERKKRFLTALVGVLIVGGGAVLLTDQYISRAIAHQNARNQFITAEIVQLDTRIKEISELKARRKQLLERMKIIQDLPDGVYFSDVKMTDKLISIAGSAESNNRVSDLLRNLDASDWLEAPSLTEVKATTAGAVDQANTFQLTVRQTQPAVEGAKP
jgi:type IV pilus assembly protein PilN